MASMQQSRSNQEKAKFRPVMPDGALVIDILLIRMVRCVVRRNHRDDAWTNFQSLLDGLISAKRWIHSVTASFSQEETSFSASWGATSAVTWAPNPWAPHHLDTFLKTVLIWRWHLSHGQSWHHAQPLIRLHPSHHRHEVFLSNVLIQTKNATNSGSSQTSIKVPRRLASSASWQPWCFEGESIIWKILLHQP